MEPAAHLTPSLDAGALDFAAGRREPAAPRHAATVVLVRDPSTVGGPGSLEVYLLRRHLDMAFAAGRCVFPGGRVDPRDFDHEAGWAGPSPAEWAARLRLAEPLARALVCAAVRETFEESGVLLAGPSATEVVSDTTGPQWEADRAALESHAGSLTDLLGRRGLVLRTDLLRFWSRWLTPDFEPRRYDTVFFLARLPTGQRTRDVSTESDQVQWMSVGAAMDAVDDGELVMLPPTYLTCAQLHEHGDVDSADAGALDRDAGTIEPWAVPAGDGARLKLPTELLELVAGVRAERARGGPGA